MISEAMCGRIGEILRPWLGSNIVDAQLCYKAAEILTQQNVRFSDMCRAVESLLFNTLYENLGVHMTLRLPDGRDRRIYLAQLPAIADDVMGALFEALPVYSPTYCNLTDYMLKTGSFSAMRTLCLKYRRQLGDQEYARVVNVIRENYPPERYADWLDA